MRPAALSIVIISRNEEANIERCIASISAQVVAGREDIVLVDSASTDRTIHSASRYPITILQLDPNAELSPSAGRFVGLAHARGEFIQFLDGDMILIEGWLDAAMKVMSDMSVAAVGGRMFRVFPGEVLNRSHPDSHVPGRVPSLGGAGLYRVSALAESGGFNPFVKGEEERELGYRLAKAGYALLRIDVPMVYHMEKHRTTSEVDEKASHFFGVGQILREYRGCEIASNVVVRQSAVLCSAAYLVGGILLLALLALLGGAAIRISLFAFTLSGLIFLVATGRLRRSFLYVRFRLLLLVHLVRGFARGIARPSEYKVNVTTLQSSPHPGGEPASP